MIFYGLYASAALYEIEQDDDNGYHQQDMDETAHCVAAHQSQQPQDYQYYGNCPQHGVLLSILFESVFRPAQL
jgi:hypothetical protein